MGSAPHIGAMVVNKICKARKGIYREEVTIVRFIRGSVMLIISPRDCRVVAGIDQDVVVSLGVTTMPKVWALC